MKVLFAVSNENITTSIVKKYQQKYKEIITSKNVYYFNAIIKELQKDKTYDRIVISEDLEPVSNNNYDAVDKFIFDKLDNISDEASNLSGSDVPIILICSDRRGKSDPLLIKLFGIGIYNAILGNDRSIDVVCNLINKPRSKKEAKLYYRIDSEDVDYKPENESDVSETEIQNILAHYRKLGKNEDQYVQSFDKIAAQYTDSQLRVIIKFLPLNVKAVLEAGSEKYQEIMMGKKAPSQRTTPQNFASQTKTYQVKSKQKQQEATKIDFVEKEINSQKLTRPVVIPSSVDASHATVVENTQTQENNMQTPHYSEPVNPANPFQNNYMQQMQNAQSSINTNPMQTYPTMPLENTPKSTSIEEKEETTTEAIDTGFTLPGLDDDIEEQNNVQEQPSAVAVPKRRGRPRKNPEISEENKLALDSAVPKRRGRPRKVQPQEETTTTQPVNLFDLDQGQEEENNQEKDDLVLPGFDDVLEQTPAQSKPVNLFDLDEDEKVEQKETSNEDNQPSFVQQENIPDNNAFKTPYQLAMENQNEVNELQDNPFMGVQDESIANPNYTPNYQDANLFKPSYQEPTVQNNDFYKDNSGFNQNVGYEASSMNNSLESTNPDLNTTSNLISSNQKLVAFVGTSKNGTSFLVNNLAQLLSQKGIKTAILDLTQNRNSYYIYTENEESLRQTAFNCMNKLTLGQAEGINVNRNLSVYTALPGENDIIAQGVNSILQTLTNNYSLVLMDCDFNTPDEYFAQAQEIYLVQSMDVLTIQPLTEFLKGLKHKSILDPNKLRAVINKTVRLRGVNEKVIIGGMAFYNEPAMTLMTELFNKDTIKYVTIPFDDQAYAHYLEALINCQISLNGYSQALLSKLEELANMVYPLISSNSTGTMNKKQSRINKKTGGYTPYSPKNNQNNGFSNNMNETLNKMKSQY